MSADEGRAIEQRLDLKPSVPSQLGQGLTTTVVRKSGAGGVREVPGPASVTGESQSLSQLDPALEGVHNTEVLLTLLSNDDEDDRLLKAELYRELGRFDQAKEILIGLAGGDPPSSRLLELCDKQDRRVVAIAADGVFASSW
jgi:hypothetical protein